MIQADEAFYGPIIPTKLTYIVIPDYDDFRRKKRGDIDDYEIFRWEIIETPINISLFGQSFSQLFIGLNGVISFDRGFPEGIPRPLPLDDTVLIAPFWADLDTENSGSVHHRVLKDTEYESIQQEIHDAFPLFENFKITWGLVATWYEVPYFNNSNSTNTFQCLVVAQNDSQAFTIFNYVNLDSPFI